MPKEAPIETFVRVVAPHFVAGLIVVDNRVFEAAPILSWMIGKDQQWIRSYFKKKGWKAYVVKEGK
jgi:hypothetical protein